MDTFSEVFADAVERTSNSVVMVAARRRYPLSGVVATTGNTMVIVTTSRAVEDEDAIRVTLADGSEIGGSLVGRDPRSDLALLRPETDDLTPLTWAIPEALRVGQWLLMLGRPKGLEASAGMLGALGKHLRVDAPPFRGFSGGPLVTLGGALVGVVRAAWGRGDAVVIPGGVVQRVAQDLLEHGSVKHLYLGISGHPVRLPEAQRDTLGQRAGLLLTAVEPNSPAAEAGLVLGDAILQFGGARMHRPEHLMHLLDEVRVGDTVSLRLLRSGEVLELPVTLQERP